MPNDDIPPAPTPPPSPADDVEAFAARLLRPYLVDPRDADDPRRHARGAELLRCTRPPMPTRAIRSWPGPRGALPERRA